jgi:peptidoglycan/xylan/chitin deacetylase (PgdA/CDA1 family)
VSRRLINITFHGIGEPGRALDPGEQSLWLGRDRFLSVLDSVAGRGDVNITFDDGNASDVELALPALRERGLTATFFVVAGRLRTHGFLDADGVRRLASAGMTIGCHGMRHRPWRGLDDRALREELGAARRVLEDVVAGPLTRAACPFGGYDRRVLRALRACGYRAVYTSDGGTTRSGAWVQARTTVRATDGPGLLARIESSERAPHMALRRRATRAAKRWR